MGVCTRVGVVTLVLLASFAVATRDAAAATGSGPVLTLIGDSVADRIERDTDALRRLNSGFTLNLQTRGCRRLATPSCVIEGTDEGPPPNVVQLASQLGRRLGKIVVIAVGYNDDPAWIDRDLDRVMRALLRQGVRRVIWLTLREARPVYARANRSIEAERSEWPMLTLADWDSHSAGHPDWFEADGLHLTPKGGMALAVFVRAAARRLS